MVLLPVNDTRQRHFSGKLRECDFNGQRFETDCFSRLGEPQQGNAVAGYETFFAHVRQPVPPAMIPGYHQEACRTAITGVVLVKKPESHHSYFKALAGLSRRMRNVLKNKISET